ncbi:uncharacterized protein LOC135489989 [Lineus longissimus]|uniref:uncharacterized protein LOC135489989 n=1 Tax=Lineus longissimus TaxID=88925 RepID=UPI00315DEEB1
MEDAIFDPDTKENMAIKQDNKPHIMKQVLQGVAYMHSLAHVALHRDIKPSNILIKRGCFTTKLCDLGVSLVKKLFAGTTTAFGSTPGSPSYMSPECLLGEAKSSTGFVVVVDGGQL